MKNKKKLTDQELEMLRSLSGIRVPMEMMSTILKISKDTLDRMYKANDKVRAAIDEGRARASTEVRKTLYEMAVREKNPRMMEFWCKTQEGFKTTDRLELTGANGAPLHAMSDEELLKRAAKLKAKLNRPDGTES